MIEFRRILLPTDFSESSLAATKYAVDLARRFGATLHLLHVIEDPVVYMPMFESFPVPTRDEFEQFARTRLDAWILSEDAAGLTIERRFVHGSPSVEVLKDIDEHDIDLVVLGTHGRSFAAHLLMGSVAEKVVRHANCPVLTIRAREA